MAEPAIKIELPLGRTIYLKELRQYFTYEGLLEGLPTVEMNKRKLVYLFKEEAKKIDPQLPYLLVPDETPIEYDRKYPFGTPSALPSITCIGRFQSLSPARDAKMDASELVIIWFQPEFAIPINPSIVTQIQAIDWDQHANDYEY